MTSNFTGYCWKLSGNSFLVETLERLMAPLFTFVVLASAHPLTAAMGREHYALVEALRSMEEPEFSAFVRKTFTGICFPMDLIRRVKDHGSSHEEPTST